MAGDLTRSARASAKGGRAMNDPEDDNIAEDEAPTEECPEYY
jgi:hypothetical protein